MDRSQKGAFDTDRRLSTFIREHLGDILSLWEATVRQLPIARDLERPVLIDHLPELLERIADMADELAAGAMPRLTPDLAEVHALERLEVGLDLAQVVAEYSALRDCIVRLWSERSRGGRPDIVGARALNQAIDKAVGASVQRYTVARDRTLQSLDRIAAAALETRSLDEFLDRLLQVLLETTAAVDTATILLRDGDVLRTRASVGLGADADSFVLPIGEELTDARFLNPALRAKGVKALFGIPLVEGARLIGVAQMGSTTAAEFSQQDRQLFTAMGHRATAAIFQHMLREEAESRARQQLALATLGMHAFSGVEPAALLDEAVRSIRVVLRTDFASVLERQADGGLRVVTENGWGAAFLGSLPLRPGEQSHEDEALRAPEPVVISDVAQETRFCVPAFLRERGIRSGMCVRIPQPGEMPTYGVLCTHALAQRSFHRDDVAFLQSVAYVVGTAIALRRSEQARAELLAREQARRAELEAVIESIPGAVIIGGRDGITRCNQAALDLLGLDSCDDVRLRSIANLLATSESRDLDTGAPISQRDSPFARALAGETTSRNVSIRNARTGHAIALRSSAAPILHGDAVIGAVSISTDITDERQAHLALSDALAQQKAARDEAERVLAILDSVLSASALGIGFIDTELRYIRINHALAAINGRTPAEHIGRTLREVLPDPVADFLEPICRRVMETREPVMNLELDAAPASTPDRVRSFIANYVPVVTAKGEVIGIGAVVIEITDRKAIENALREREAQFRTLADNIPQLAWMADEVGNIFWYNRRWYEYTGTTPEQMVGDGWQEVHHPEHLAGVVAKFRRDIIAGDAWEDTMPLRGRDGTFRWFLSRAVPVRDEHGKVERWFGTNTDVTEGRFLNEATMLLSSSLDYLATLQKIADLAASALGEWCVVDLVDDGGVRRVAASRSERARGTPPSPDELLAQRSRDRRHHSIAEQRTPGTHIVAPLVARGRVLGAISFGSEASGRMYEARDVEVAEELGHRAGLAVDNARLLEDAQREAQMREEVLAVVSHDLKNPLAAIHVATTTLLSKQEPHNRKTLQIIHRAATRMDHLIGDLLDMATIQAGRLVLETRSEDAAALVRDAIDLHEPMAVEKGIAIVSAFELEGVRVSCDRERLLQVFANLLGNAIKFCRARDTITIRADRDGAMLRFAIEDTGPGIPPDQLAHIFEPYWSAKEHAKKGTGLGLYISRGIVEAHGGQLGVESEQGKGTTFTFTVPMHQGSDVESN